MTYSLTRVVSLKKTTQNGKLLGTSETGVSNLLVSLGHTGRRRVALGHTLYTQTLTETDEQKKNGFR